MKCVKLQEHNGPIQYALIMNAEEAKTIKDISGRIKGSFDNSRRQHMDKVWAVMTPYFPAIGCPDLKKNLTFKDTL